MVYVKKYARVINELENPNVMDKVNWENKQYAINGNKTQEAYSFYTEKKTYIKTRGVWAYNYPEHLSARDYGLEIPEDAKINYIRFGVCLRAEKGLEVIKPTGRMMFYGGTGQVEEVPSGKTGWFGGIWTVVPTDFIPQHESLILYTMMGDVWEQKKYPISTLNSVGMGLDIQFRVAHKFKRPFSTLYLNYVFVEVDYTPSKTTITYNPAETSQDNPYTPLANENFDVEVIFKQNEANAGTKTFDVDIPWGTEIVSWSATTGVFNPNTKKYTLELPPNSTNTLTLTLKANGVGTKQLKVYNEKVSSTFYYYPALANDTDYFTANIVADKVRNGYPSCFTYNIQSESTATPQTFTLTFIKDNEYVSVRRISCKVNNELSSEGVALNDIVSLSQGRIRVTLDVPTNQTNNIVFTLCVYPRRVTGTITATISDDYSHETYSQDFNCLDPYVYHLGNSDKITSANYNFKCIADDVVLNSHRIASELETDVTYLACEFDSGDAVMTMSDSSLTAHFYEQVDYIGCVPLEQTHFNPKSTYKDKLLDSRYKNKRYMGKQLASDEDITLNVRLHPHQVTTIQGLIDMDKPIPINANHKCFEGDSLNHRGWCEIYGVKTEQTGNNPHWYKCDIDVKYITHNLNTRFNIHRGVKSYPFDIPDLLVPVNTYADNLVEFFDVRTDGTYEYRADYTIEEEGEDPITIEFEDDKRNKFELDSGQSLYIQTKEALSNRCDLTVNWISNKLAEDKENRITRIFRIRDKKTKQAVFEYEYSDFDFSDLNYIGTNVKGRQLYKGAYDPLAINRVIDLRREISSDVNPETGEITVDDDEVYFGSTLHFQINNKNLTVIDEGFNGKEMTFNSTKPLEGSNYIFEVEIKNNNTDAETDDIVTYISIAVNETLLDTARFNDYYDKMVVSPFPVADRKVLFVRNAEEGNIYYLEDDGLKEFSYIIDPYYQYKNGVDLQSDDGTSIFNLNYSYEMIYVQNGLVRLGINRINGSIILAKYDASSNEYIITSRFKLNNEKDVGITYLTDDKIVLHAGDSKFTMWRGHPYVMVNHSGEDLIITNNYTRVWAESVGDDVSEYPCYYDLMNSKNLLPKNLGGNVITTDDLSSEELEVAHLNLTLTKNTNPIYVDEEASFTISGDVSMIDEVLPVQTDGALTYDGVLGDYSSEIEIDHTRAFETGVYVEKDVIANGETINVTGTLYDYAHVGISTSRQLSLYCDNYLSFLDYGISASYNDSWYVSRLTPTVTSTGTALANSSTSGSGFYLAYETTPSSASETIQFHPSAVVEFDVVNVGSLSYVQVYGHIDDENLGGLTRSFSQLGASNGSHVKVEFDADEIRVYVDGTLAYTETVSLIDARIGFRVDMGGSFKFKNFHIIENNKLIGQGATNVKGEYTTTLTGQGNGFKNIWAEYSTLKSTKHQIKDVEFYDAGITNDYNTDWYNHAHRISVEHTDEYTSLTNVSATGGFYCANKFLTPKGNLDEVVDWNPPLYFEFDVVDYTGTVHLRYYDSQTRLYQRLFSDLGIKQGSHVVCYYEDGVMTYEVDGVTYTWTGELDKTRIEFRLDVGANLKYKNFLLFDTINEYEPSEEVFIKTISLAVSSTSVTSEDEVTLTASLYNSDGTVATGQTIGFYADGVRIGTAQTNSSGLAKYYHTFDMDGSVGVYARIGRLQTRTINIDVAKVGIPRNITLTSTEGSVLTKYNNQSTILRATVTDINDDPVEGVPVIFHYGNHNITKTTDSNGVGAYRYYATGSAGDTVFTADTNEGELVSNSLTIRDCYWIERGSDSSGYTVSNGTLTLSSGTFNLTKGSGSGTAYFRWDSENLPLADFKGKEWTIIANATINATKLRSSLYYNNGSWSQVPVDKETTGLIENTITVPSNATQIRSRFDLYGSEGDTVMLKNVRFLLK